MAKGDQLYNEGKAQVSFNLARLKYGGENFEVVVHPELAIDFKQGRNLDLRDVILSEHVFSDAKRGLKVSEQLMKKLFNTSDGLKVAEEIIRRGEIQLTSEYREKLREEKRKKIIDTIHRNSVDPKTGLPHPPLRIENAMAEAKVRIDEHKRAEDQVQDIVRQIRSVLPVRFEVREIEVTIPASFAARSYSVLKNFGTILKDEWQNDGSLRAVIEMPAGLQQDFFDDINKATHGNCETKVIRSK